jgi:hypothetical protein
MQKVSEKHRAKKSNEDNPTRKKEGREACHNINTDLMQSVTKSRRRKIGTQSIMKHNKKTLHEFSPDIPPKTSKGNIKPLFE